MTLNHKKLHFSVFLLIQLLFAVLVTSTLYEAYPINKQIPPIARIDEAFTFIISNETYKSNVDKSIEIAYNAYDLPDWLSFDSSSRTFSGTPPASFLENSTNIQYFNIILEGTDSSDSTSLNETYTLVVSNQTSIAIADNFNLLAQLKSYGYTDGKDALILYPGEIFNVTFDRTSFTNSDSITSFYGRTEQYNAPLPSWLFFDSSTLKFSGTAPAVNSQIAPEEIYEFTLIATDIDGFSAVEIPFQLAVGAHQLTTSIQNTILINVTDSGSFTYQLPLDYVFFDGSEITSTNLGSMVLEGAPSWVTLSNDTLSGTMDNQTTIGNFSVAIYDNYGDVIYLNFEVESTSKLFAVTSLPNINATRGTWFQYSFLPSQFTSYVETNVSVTYPNTSQSNSWLNFKSSNLTIYGEVPQDFDLLTVGVVAEYNSQSQELDFQIVGMSASTRNRTSHNSTNTTTTSSSMSSSTSLSSTSTAASSTTAASTVDQNRSHSSKKTVAIACGVAIPVFVIGVLLILLLILWRRRRANKENNGDKEKLPIARGPTSGARSNSPDTITAMHNPFIGDNSSSGSGSSNSSTMVDEKARYNTANDSSSIENVFSDAFDSQSRENLLSNFDDPRGTSNKKSAFFNPYDRSSSFYMDSQPVNSKSWRNNSMYAEGDNRRSAMSLNTVTTAELLNTEIKDDEPMKKDPRKSSLGFRDSVFWSNKQNRDSDIPLNVTNQTDVLPPLEEHGDLQSDLHIDEALPHSKSYGSESNSSNDDFIPIKRGDDYKWIHSKEPNRKPSKKRFVNIESEGNINVGQVSDMEGQVPEMI